MQVVKDSLKRVLLEGLDQEIRAVATESIAEERQLLVITHEHVNMVTSQVSVSIFYSSMSLPFPGLLTA